MSAEWVELTRLNTLHALQAAACLPPCTPQWGRMCSSSVKPDQTRAHNAYKPLCLNHGNLEIQVEEGWVCDLLAHVGRRERRVGVYTATVNSMEMLHSRASWIAWRQLPLWVLAAGSISRCERRKKATVALHSQWNAGAVSAVGLFSSPWPPSHVNTDVGVLAQKTTPATKRKKKTS